MLERILEPEVMDDRDEAVAYGDMNHDAVNEKFAEDLVAIGELGSDCLDIGTGTALIPVVLCQKHPRHSHHGMRCIPLDAGVSTL
jgi:hypothetical protein